MQNLSNILEKNIKDILYYDKGNAIENIVKTVFETILLTERTEFLGSNKNEKIKNKGNGYYEKIAKYVNKYLKISIPRDRLGLFKPLFLEAIKDKEEEMLDMAFKLYTKGLTTRDIRDIFEDVYDKKISPSSISNITKEFEGNRKIWQNRKLEEEYYFVYIDAIFIPIRRETVEKEAFYAIIGLKKDLKREILGVYNIPQESSQGWREVLIDLKKRGLKNVLMFIADGLTGLENVVKELFPKSFMQKCLLHKIKNVLLRIRASEKDEITKDFHNVFKLEDPNYTIDTGKENLNNFISKWQGKYSWMKNKFKNEHLDNYFAYLNFPYQIHRMIYTTNWVERLNKGIRRTQRMRNAFPNPDSALNLICAYLMGFEERVYKYPITSFIKVQDILNKMSEDYSFIDT